MTSAPVPAQMLLGAELDGGWKVTRALSRPPGQTGGNFSYGYVVEGPDARNGFLKALDYSRALRSPDPARSLQTLTQAYNFERELLSRCRTRRLDRVVTAISDGTYDVPNAGPLARVQYIIFEQADGNARTNADASSKFDVAWSLRALHHVATGLWQLHSQGIAHQDLKPSNILTFGKRSSKVADLGRASAKGTTAPHNSYPVAGDPSYAPPELLYNYIDPDWNRRRLACDAYLLGSMVIFFLTGVGSTACLLSKLTDPLQRPQFWGGTYADILPYLRDAFSLVCTEVYPQIHQPVREGLGAVIAQLCDPDPSLRGHPKNRSAHSDVQYSLERYVSEFDLLARKAEITLGSTVTP